MKSLSSVSRHTSRRAAACRARAYTLAEMLLAVSLFSVVGLAATQLFRANLIACQRCREAGVATARLDSAIAALRADVWVAHQFSSAGPQDVTLGGVGGRAVQWRFEGGTLTRTAGDGDVRRWEGIGTGVSFVEEGPTLGVVFPDGGGDPSRRENPPAGAGGGEVQLVSQWMLAAKAGGGKGHE